MNESLAKWLPLYTEALQSRPSSSKQKFDPVEVCPLLYTTRIATAKILIELEDWDNATKVFKTIQGQCYVILGVTFSCILNEKLFLLIYLLGIRWAH